VATEIFDSAGHKFPESFFRDVDAAYRDAEREKKSAPSSPPPLSPPQKQESHPSLPHGAQGAPVATHTVAVGEQPRMSVAEAQAILKAQGHDLGHYGAHKDGVDGIKGEMTTAAIQQFQKAHHMKPTGELDASTIGALRAESKGQSHAQQQQQHQHQQPQQQQPQQPHMAAANGFDGANHITTKETGAAFVAAGMKPRDVILMAERLKADMPSLAGHSPLGEAADRMLGGYLDKEGTITVNGQPMSAAEAKLALGSANGRGGAEDAKAAAVMRAVDKQLEREHPEIQAEGHQRSGKDHEFGHLDLGHASRGLKSITGMQHAVEHGSPVKIAQAAMKAAGRLL